MISKAYIVHGYLASPQRNWFPWLAGKLMAAGIDTHCIELPSAEQPHFDDWQQALAETIGTPNEQTLLVAHSLGCISLLHYLSQARPQQIGGLILASGFAEHLPALPELNLYIDQTKFDSAAICATTPHIFSLISDNDSIVPPILSKNLAHKLGSHIHTVANGGHLLDSDGFAALLPAWQVARAILATA